MVLVQSTASLPSLESLRCFVAAARHLNFRRAARTVALTPGALGQRIKQLEAEVGAALFVRTTREVRLTEAGLATLPYAQAVLDGAAEVLRAASGNKEPAPLDVTIGTRHELGLSWLVPLLPALGQTRPNLTVHLYFGSGPDLVRRVRAAELDCAVTSTRISDPKLTTLKLHEEGYVFVGAQKLLRKVPLAGPSDAPRHSLIDTEEGLPLYRYFHDADGAPALRFARVLKMGTIAAIRALCLRGEGLAVLPAYFVAEDLRRGTLRRVLPRVALPSDWFWLVCRADDPKRALYERLAEILRREPLR